MFNDVVIETIDTWISAIGVLGGLLALAAVLRSFRLTKQAEDESREQVAVYELDVQNAREAIRDQEAPAVETETKSLNVETIAAEISAQLGAAVGALDSLKGQIAADVDNLKAQVDVEQMKLAYLSQQAHEQQQNIERSKDPAKLADHLDSVITNQTKLIEGQSRQIEELGNALESMSEKAAKSGRLNIVLSIALAVLGVAAGFLPVLLT